MKPFIFVLSVVFCLAIEASSQQQWKSAGEIIREKITESHNKVMTKANELLLRLQTDNRTEDVKQLQKAMQIANSIFHDFVGMNLNQEFNFSVKAMIERLKQAEQHLQKLIDLLNGNKNK